MLPTLAIASMSTTDPFHGFAGTVLEWAAGPLGTGLAVLAMLVGLMVALGWNISGRQNTMGNPMAALMGVGLALVLSLGPEIIVDLIAGGALLPH